MFIRLQHIIYDCKKHNMKNGQHKRPKTENSDYEYNIQTDNRQTKLRELMDY